jgi:hypothetical protein
MTKKIEEANGQQGIGDKIDVAGSKPKAVVGQD